jgi:hypothetical protein
VTAPRGDHRLFVLEREGRIEILEQDGTKRGTFLDLSDRLPERVFGDRGLLGLAFSPTYASDGLFYVCYTARTWAVHLSRFQVSDDPDVAEPESEEILLDLEKNRDDHNGGHLAFGPDDMLYVALGDGGLAGDPADLAQNPASLFGKILRLDVRTGLGGAYAIPPDNPLVRRISPEGPSGSIPRGEIWAIGLRDPSALDFDEATGDLYIADLGQRRRQEINVQPAGSPGGENYGWRRMEGSLCFEPPNECDSHALALPVYEFDDPPPDACAPFVGGVVYRGPIRELDGHYVFTDVCADRVLTFRWNGGTGYTALVDRTRELSPRIGGEHLISNVCRDGLGNLYFVRTEGGTLHRLTDRTAVDARARAVSTTLLEIASPNPMTRSTSVRLTVPDQRTANVAVYDASGRQVRSLGAGLRGAQELLWDRRDDTGLVVAPGVYIVQVTTLGRVDRMAITVMP